MNAIIKVSGVLADGLARLSTFLTRTDLFLDDPKKYEEQARQWVVLKDVRLEEDKKMYLVTVEVLLAAEESPGSRVWMKQQIFADLFRTLHPYLLSRVDVYGDRELTFLQFLVGRVAPFEVRANNGLIIFQNGQKITASRLEELVGARHLEWQKGLEQTSDDVALLDKVLSWLNEGGYGLGDFEDYTKD